MVVNQKKGIRMKKVLGLALAMIAGVSFAASAAVNDIKVSGNITTTGVVRDFDLGSDKTQTNGDALQARFLVTNTKLRFDADLTEDVAAVVELQNVRVWGSTSTADTEGETTLRINQSYVKFDNFLGMPATFKLGRQNVVFGSGLVVRLGQYHRTFTAANNAALAEGLNDSIATDAARLTFDLDPITIDSFIMKHSEGDIHSRQDDLTTYGVEVAYDINDDAMAAVYAVARDENVTTPTAYTEQVYIYGVRSKAKLTDNIDVFGEYALERGSTTGNVGGTRGQRKASMLDLGVNYKLNDDNKTKFGFEYMYATGDKTATDSDDNTYNKLHGGFKTGLMGNMFFNSDSNLRVFKLSAATNVREDVKVSAAYYNFAQANNGGSYPRAFDMAVNYDVDTDNRELGQSIDLGVAYDYTEDVQFGAKAGFLFPGQYFGSANDQTAYETRLYAKVSF